MNVYALLSNLILLIHVGFVGFIVVGLVVIWVGYFRHWRFVSNYRLRLAHLLAMGFVLFEAVVGMMCPLTVWEMRLRVRAGQEPGYEGSFLEYWAERILFFDLGQGVFTALYAAVFGLVLLSWWVVPPRRRP